MDWLSFNLEGLINPEIIAHRLSKYFTPHFIVDDKPYIRFHGLKKNIKFLSVAIANLTITGLGLRLFSLEKMRLIFISLSKLRSLLGVF